MKNYYNTTGYAGEQLEMFKLKAYNQDEKIYKLYQKYKDLTPSQCHQVFGVDECPLTSIRRSITNLTSDGKLIKTTRKQIGIYKRDEYVWTLKTNKDV